jgi:hypothetical protein
MQLYWEAALASSGLLTSLGEFMNHMLVQPVTNGDPNHKQEVDDQDQQMANGEIHDNTMVEYVNGYDQVYDHVHGDGHAYDNGYDDEQSMAYHLETTEETGHDYTNGEYYENEMEDGELMDRYSPPTPPSDSETAPKGFKYANLNLPSLPSDVNIALELMHEYCQKSLLPPATFDILERKSGFISTVTLCSRSFRTTRLRSKKSDSKAESGLILVLFLHHKLMNGGLSYTSRDLE